MIAAGNAGAKGRLHWLLGPSQRIVGEENRSGARLLAVLTLVHLLAVILSSAIGTVFRWHMTSKMLLRGPLFYALLSSCLLVLAAYALVRTGRYRVGVGLYVASTLCLPLLVPFVGGSLHEAGLLSLAFVPVVIAATLLSQRWFIIVVVAMVACLGFELVLVTWPAREIVLGFTILLVVIGSSILMAVMLRHQAKLESLRTARLQRSERRYRTLFETVTDGIFLAGRDGRIVEVNDSACRMLGYAREELLRMRMDEVVPEDRREHLAEINRAVAEKGRFVFEGVHRRKDGSIYPIEVAASVTELDRAPAFMGVVRDITDRVRAEAEKRRLQDELQHAMKMESIGRLAGGVAHDFNNLLTAILGNADLALFQLRQGADVREALSEIREAAISAATVTRQLLAFSRKHVIEAKPVDVNGLIGHMQKMLGRLIGEDVRLRTVAGHGLGIVKADPGLIEQAIMNLVVNARDAMPQGGDLVIETAAVTLDETQAQERRLAGAGRHVLLSITDTGTGMTDEVKCHLFEPFFTTKPRGKGTGLGLATTYVAVEQSGGSIEVWSEVGKGTTVRIYLPAIPATAGGEARPPGAAGGALPGGKESILVVEDDERVREVLTQSLRGWGYEVMVAATGEEALALAVARTGRIDLLLTDVILPGMNGREMAQALAKVHPETRTLFCSGYGENIIAHGGALEAGIEFVSKPYRMDALARRVREILDRS
ncbi:MAG: PAS domain S-box protein [Deltaproteobacteria bacterium]|nr:PAS domain S-box protein [Deltaproteobacteria bacterium]